MRSTLAVALVLSAVALATARGADAPAPAPADNDQATLEREFADLLTGATLAGSFTAGPGGQPRQDRYTIVRAVKAKGDDWVITAKIEYKGIGLPVDITVPVRWAGDTPVISVTNQRIPGFGTFTARVMFYAGQYAGTWDAGDHGGLMWGRVEKAKADAPATRPAP